jgi:hypothetical protein
MDRFALGTGTHQYPPEATEKLSTAPLHVSPAYIFTLAELSFGAGAAETIVPTKVVIIEMIKACMLNLGIGVGLDFEHVYLKRIKKLSLVKRSLGIQGLSSRFIYTLARLFYRLAGSYAFEYDVTSDFGLVTYCPLVRRDAAQSP